MCSDPQVSVVIPVWRASPEAPCWLDEALDSVRAQSFAGWEVIVVDDGSPVPVAPAIADDVVLVRERNTGPGGARNSGAALARGEFVAYLDSDDRWRPRKLERQLALHRWRDDLVLSATDVVRFEDATVTGESRTVPDAGASYHEISFRELVRENCVPCSSAMCRRAALEKTVGMTPHRRIGEDYALWLRLARFGPVARLGEVLLERRVHPGSLMQQHMRQGSMAMLEREVYGELIAESPDLAHDPAVRAALARIGFEEGWTMIQRREWARARRALLQSLQLDLIQPKAWLNLVRASLRIDAPKPAKRSNAETDQAS